MTELDKRFNCGARSVNLGANDPQECNWPMCGCDPYADKVIAALQESGVIRSYQLHEVIPGMVPNMKCTRCNELLNTGEKFHRTKRGPYHQRCPKPIGTCISSLHTDRPHLRSSACAQWKEWGGGDASEGRVEDSPISEATGAAHPSNNAGMTELDKARPHLVHEAYVSLLKKAAEWDEDDWERADKYERHAVNAALDLREARTAELTAYLEACKAVEGERIHYSAIADSGSYNRAIDRAIKAIRSLSRFAELLKKHE